MRSVSANIHYIYNMCTYIYIFLSERANKSSVVYLAYLECTGCRLLHREPYRHCPEAQASYTTFAYPHMNINTIRFLKPLSRSLITSIIITF